ncbi:MAG TPA: CVNH domain-containing protein [Rhizomicrobium sp.]|jgi:hypothetical protein|nr:CVNH domain-containing protein [Rhizomicrobium sp.]
MKFLQIGALALLAALSSFALTTGAEARWAPSGSYADSCRHIDFDGDVLTATCRMRDGSWRNTYLTGADDCEGRIVNNNGQLECGYTGWRDHDRYNDGGPSGSYERSCANIRMDGYTLRATCQRRDGSWRWTSLDDAYDCDGHIGNDNGNLVCGRGWRH